MQFRGLGPLTILPRRPDPRALRRNLVLAYRVLGPVGLLAVLLGLLSEADLIGPSPEWVNLSVVLIGMLLALCAPLVAATAVALALWLGRDWRATAPLWLFAAAGALLLTYVFGPFDGDWIAWGSLAVATAAFFDATLFGWAQRAPRSAPDS